MNIKYSIGRHCDWGLENLWKSDSTEMGEWRPRDGIKTVQNVRDSSAREQRRELIMYGPRPKIAHRMRKKTLA